MLLVEVDPTACLTVTKRLPIANATAGVLVLSKLRLRHLRVCSVLSRFNAEFHLRCYVGALWLCVSISFNFGIKPFLAIDFVCLRMN